MASTSIRPRPHDGALEDSLEVIFIGDDRGLAELYRLKLELDGYWVTLSASLEDGIEHMKSRMPDIIFLDLGPDVRSPDSDLGMLREHAALREVPVVLLSRRDHHAAEALASRLGSRDFLVRVDTVPGEDFQADPSGVPTHLRHS